MSENTETTTTEQTRTSDAIVDAVFDIGGAWATYGLKVGRMALLTSARTLSHAARALEAVQNDLEKKAEAQPTTDAPAQP